MEEKEYIVNTISKSDVLDCFAGKENFEAVRTKLENMPDHKMVKLAERLRDDYCNQLFWQSLRIIFEDEFL